MKKDQIRLLVVIAITFLTAVLVHGVDTMAPIKNDKFFNFPLAIGEWQGSEVAISEWAYNGLETPYVFLRNYTSPRHSLPVNLSLVWFDDTNYAFHAPEACMSSLIRERQIANIKIAEKGLQDVVEMIVEINNRKHLLLYFFDVDGLITTRQEVIRLESLKKRLRFRRTSATFVRVMAPIERRRENAREILQKFLDDICKVIPEYTYTDRILPNSDRREEIL